jgi:hypothetical protein
MVLNGATGRDYWYTGSGLDISPATFLPMLLSSSKSLSHFLRLLWVGTFSSILLLSD